MSVMGRRSVNRMFCLMSSAVYGVVFVFMLSACGDSSSSTIPPLSEVETKSVTNARELTEQAYLFGFPLVEHFKLLRTYLEPNSAIGANIFVHRDSLATADSTAVVSPNNDTLYSSVVLDLRSEPVVISIPEVNDRYFSIQLVNVVTDNLPLIASEQEGAESGSYILVGPDWDDSSFSNEQNLPVIQSDSSVVLGLLRIGVADEADVTLALSYQSQVLVHTYSEYFGLVSPDPLEALLWPEEFDAKTNSSAEFFSYLNFMMQFHQFDESENELLDAFAVLNIGVGEEFILGDFDGETQGAIIDGISTARSAIQFPSDFGTSVNGWNIPADGIGNYGFDYTFRSIVAWYGLYALPLSEAAYFSTIMDDYGESLNGSNAYELYFSADELPPESYFWSLTLYGENYFLVENSIDRYSLGDRSDFLQFNDDGSLNIYIQAANPGQDLESNWLPAPEGEFRLSFRIYGPDAQVQSGEYHLPAVQRIQEN